MMCEFANPGYTFYNGIILIVKLISKVIREIPKSVT
jgi:hypothetical protein